MLHPLAHPKHPTSRLKPRVKPWEIQGSPHVRGDGPVGPGIRPALLRFSPRAWGWSGPGRALEPECVVLPTCVGMVRPTHATRAAPGSSPHVRGDGPSRDMSVSPPLAFSPRAWGWSDPRSPEGLLAEVLPTCVGMVRIETQVRGSGLRSPHVRGDGPAPMAITTDDAAFSPRAWGWSGVPHRGYRPMVVLPTCVGMVRG